MDENKWLNLDPKTQPTVNWRRIRPDMYFCRSNIFIRLPKNCKSTNWLRKIPGKHCRPVQKIVTSARYILKIADAGLSKSEIEKFYSDFENISTYIAVEKLMGWSYSEIKDFTLGTNPDTYDGLPLIPKNLCLPILCDGRKCWRKRIDLRKWFGHTEQ